MLMVGIDETCRLAELLARILRAGDCVTLEGDLGAGKTTFARRLIRELVDEEIGVISPTFNLLQSYDAQLINGEGATLWHYDLYRLEEPEEIEELALEEALDSGVTLIEWPEIVDPWLPKERIRVVLEFAEHESNRDVTIRGEGVTEERLRQSGVWR